MRTDDNLIELEKEMKNIKWHVIVLCETRLLEQKVTILKSGHNLFQNNGTKHLETVAFKTLSFKLSSDIQQSCLHHFGT